MRLLQYNKDGKFSLTKDFVSDEIPKYAILSHTWGADIEEVTYQDLMNGIGKDKIGYEKIRYCGEQARRDGLHYFWVDTCCIDKSNAVELQEAINSMFRWYQNAVKCYVFLSDVSRPTVDCEDRCNRDQLPWESAFRTSRWFTRGWTLQELIAPTLIEFFSKDWKLLGDKKSLERHISEITRIPSKALCEGGSIAEFSAIERISWAETRQTTRKEDIAYSLLGIFDVYMPLIYGEGRENAMRRLQEEIDRKEKGVKHENFSIPFSLSTAFDIEHFVARENELKEIHKALLSSDSSRRTVVLYGLGGIGKTQLAIAYAKRYKNNYSAIFWLNIKDEDSLKQSYAKVARQVLQEQPFARWLSCIDMKNLDEVIDAVKAWQSLSFNTRWLMIYDNYDNPKLGNKDPAAVDIAKYLPEVYQGSIIITTRSLQVQIGRLIHVTKLENLRDSLQILSNASHREGVLDNTDAAKLAKELDGLPLALATAGAYLKEAPVAFSDYLRLYKKSWAKLQKTSPELSSYEDRTLYSTWQISFERVEQRNPLSAQLLRLWAYFDNQDVWFELIQHDSDSKNPDWILELAEDELNFHEAMRVLTDHGLIEVDKPSLELLESGGYSIHGCVHSWTIHVLNREWDYNLARVAVTCIASHVPGEQAIRPWLTQRRLLQHAARCSYIVLHSLVLDDGMAWAYHNLGRLYADQGKLIEAEQMYERALRGYETALGAEHTSTLATVNNLGRLYVDQGKLIEAKQMYERALRGYETVLGAEHTSTLATVNNLGRLFVDQGKLVEAEQMYKRALRGYETALGAEHTSTLATVHNLGRLYNDQGRLVEAKQMYERALQGREMALGAEHTSTLATVHNLGRLYIDQGKLVEAEQMFERALRGKETALGAEHTSTLATVHNLGRLYVDQGKLVEAKEMYERALRGYETALGADNITTYIPALNTLWGLGSLFTLQADCANARIMYSKALLGYEKVVGPNHSKCQSLREILQTLHSVTENRGHERQEESVNNSGRETSRGERGL